MRSTRRLTGGLGVVAATALVLAACSGTPDGGTDGSAGGEEVPEGVTEVTFWQQSFTDEENEWYESVVDSYNESQDEVHVTLTAVPGDAWEQRMTAAQAAGNAPDIRTMNYGGVRNAALTSQITPLSDLISAEAWDDLQENVRGSVTVDGEEYAYPMLVEPSAILWYRTDLFEAAGIDGPPTTWDELVADAELLTNDEVFGMRLAQNAPDLSWSTWGYQWNVAGHLPISDDWSEGMATEDYAPLLQAFQDLFASGALPPADGVGYPDASTFGDGQYAMMANGSWAASQLLNDYPDLVPNVAVAPMPSFDGQSGQTTATLGGWTWAVDGNTEVAEEAAAFIEWALGGDTENVVPFFEATQFSKVSPRVSVAEAISALPDVDSVNPWNAVIQEEIVPFAQPEPGYPWNVSLAMGEAIEAAMQGTPVSEALAAANDKINTEIANSQLAGTGS
ncbi:ABC transporter substrate-binding protein [Occultella gossypii]|uniref:Sugar ABC transporter substrate-binding protein n=1 Tax=Occultella gossypii TaxID=2800820 RepID=A0ABS7SEX1_9MICO|nr:sugar ABC transporter substrate-binding protein [Occultella gossypii]MBZ2198433.1 sugar ABC transporter substrate-binding protein [Occultella gossypii]